MRSIASGTVIALLLVFNSASAEPLTPFADAVAEMRAKPVELALSARMPAFVSPVRLRQDNSQEEKSFWRTPWPYVIIAGAVAIGVAIAAGGYGGDGEQADGLY